MDANNLNRREFLTGLAALTALSLPHLPGPDNSGGEAGEAREIEPAEVAEIDTSKWEGVVRDDSDADKIAYLKRSISVFEKLLAEMRATIAKIEAGLV